MAMGEVEGSIRLHLCSREYKGIFNSKMEGVLWVSKILILTIHQYIHGMETILLVRRLCQCSILESIALSLLVGKARL